MQSLRPSSAAPAAAGSWLVAGLLLMGVAAALTGLWYQRHQTRRCLDFYGSDAARRITTAPVVELMLVRPGAGEGRLVADRVIDVSRAPGLVHLRRGLVEDANFAWQDAAAPDQGGQRPRLPAAAWDVAIVFSDAGRGASTVPGSIAGRTTLVIDFDAPRGALAMVGRPGRIGLGRIGKGLKTWVQSTAETAP